MRRLVRATHASREIRGPLDGASGWVVADAVGRTVAGVWVAGNAVNPRAQIITAAGEGSADGIALNGDLVEDEVATCLSANVKEFWKHQLALMIWLAGFPTLIALNVALSGALDGQPAILRTFVLATIAVPIVIHGLLPQLPVFASTWSGAGDEIAGQQPTQAFPSVLHSKESPQTLAVGCRTTGAGHMTGPAGRPAVSSGVVAEQHTTSLPGWA